MKNIKKIICMTLGLLMAMSVMTAPAFAADDISGYVPSITTIKKWLNPEAEAYFKTLENKTAATRIKYQQTARANGWLVELSVYSPEYTITDATRAVYKTTDFYPCTGYAAEAYRNSTDFSGIYSCPTPGGGQTAFYFGQNCWRSSSLERFTLDRICLKNGQSFTFSDKTTGASYTWTQAEAQQALFGHSCVIFEDYAFADCKNLKSVVFTMECEDYYIAPTAFSNCPNLTITAPAGGKIEAFCKAHGIKFQSNGTTVSTTTPSQPDPTPTPAPTVDYLKPFTDVKLNQWYTDAVKWAYNKDLVDGTSSTTFSPNTNLTRAQIVQILYNQANQPKVTYAGMFTDVPSGKWYSNAVEWAAKKGLVNGIGNGQFNPNGVCTRAAVSNILYNQAGKPSVTGMKNPFTDVPANQWYTNAIIWAYNTGLVNGITTTTFQPNSACTRAQFVQILYNQAGKPALNF